MSKKIDTLVLKLLKEDVPLIVSWNRKLGIYLLATFADCETNVERLEYQLSNGLPGDRTESEDFDTFEEAESAFEERCARLAKRAEESTSPRKSKVDCLGDKCGTCLACRDHRPKLGRKKQ